MPDTHFNELVQELQNGADQKEHPFHYFTFGTVGLGRIARLRTVALRNITDDLQIFFFTDFRSKKILHIKENKQVSLLFYHPEKALQIRIEGPAKIHSNEADTKRYWSNIHGDSRKDYTTAAAPGSTLEVPDKVDYLHDQNYFCIVEVIPFKIEYLKLQKPHHLRIRYSLESGNWLTDYLVP